MVKDNKRWNVKRVERSWTDPKEYVICDGKKEIIKLSNLEEANEVCKLLNKEAPKKAGGKKSKSKKTSKEVKDNVKKLKK